MRTTMREVRALIVEAMTEALIPDSWVEQVLDLARDDFGAAEGSDIMFVQQKVGYLLMCMGLNHHERHHVVDLFYEICRQRSIPLVPYSEAAWKNDFIREVRSVEKRLPRPNPVNVIVSRDAKRKFQYEQVQVAVKDYIDGTISHTVEERPDAVWVFHPETLALKRVATYYETMSKRVRCARLRDIESGNI